MSTWKPADVFPNLSIPERAVLACEGLQRSCAEMYQLRQEIISDDESLADISDAGWDLVVCPKCGWIGFRFQCFVQARDDNGQISAYDGCGMDGCKEQVDTVLRYTEDRYVYTYLRLVR